MGKKNKNIEKKQRVKIFDIYFKKNTIFASNVYQPILVTGCDWDDERLLKDNTGENIADKNKNFAELSAHYWVWKNYLPTCEEEYIGFCHYRRFLDFDFNITPKVAFKPIKASEFELFFNKYSEKFILKCIEKYDITIPYKYYFDKSMEEQFCTYHPQQEFSNVKEIILEKYPEYYESFLEFFRGNTIYTCMNFVMKKELVEQYLNWEFDILFEAQKRSNWAEYTTYNTIRMPAYLQERLFNVWLIYQAKEKHAKIKHTTSFFLGGADYDQNVSLESRIETYKMFINSEAYFNSQSS